MGLFRKWLNSKQKQVAEVPPPAESTCSVCDIKIQGSEAMMMSTDGAITRVPISYYPEKTEFRGIRSHHLKTFKIDADRIRLLSAMHLDAKMFHFERGGYESPSKLYEWLTETHPQSSRGITEIEFRRWDELFLHLQYDSD